MRVRTRLVTVSIALLIGVGVLWVGEGAMAAPGDPGGRRFRPGAPGAGDAYFPFAGNGGYDVQHYDLDITYTPPAPDPAPLVGQLRGVATIDLVATQNLDRFNLDLRGMDVRAIKVTTRRTRPPTASRSRCRRGRRRSPTACPRGNRSRRTAGPPGSGTPRICRPAT